MAKQTVWNGTEAEMNELMAAIRRACSDCPCQTQNRKCSVLDILTDQHALNYLLFNHRTVNHLMLKEFCQE